MSTIYDVLRRPLVTEKTNMLNTNLSQYTFEVADDATKTLVKDAVETLFEGVKVARVNVLNVPAKRTRRARSRRVSIRQSAYKKAIVTLTADSKNIPLFEGVK